MSNRVAILVIASILLAGSMANGLPNGIRDLKHKLMHKFGGKEHYGAYGAASAAASASASSYGSGYGAASAAASASAGASGLRQAGYGASAARSAASASAAGGASAASTAAAAAGAGSRNYGGAAASGQAMAANYAQQASPSVSQQYYVPAPAPVVQARPMEPRKPNFDLNRFKPYLATNNGASVATGAALAGSAGAASAAGAASGAGVSSAASAAVGASSGAYQAGGYYAPGGYSAASGTFAQSNDDGLEQRHSSNEVDSMENHEMGRQDDDHYYKAQSYGKAKDDHDHINYNKNFEDVMASPTVYRSVKSNESLLRDRNKTHRESGSAVEAKDHHSAGYEKHQKQFHQKADSGSVSAGAAGGVYSSESDRLNHDLDDDEEVYFDSDGFNNGAASNYATQMAAGAGAATTVNGNGIYGGAARPMGVSFGGQYGNFGGSSSAAASAAAAATGGYSG